tara:strand:+ start:1476 stop:2495 length:1020 start_codon:yes stop_codon:yes gene_type:complete
MPGYTNESSFNYKDLSNENEGVSVDQKISQAVLNGLTLKNKRLPSWLIFDNKGSEIFSKISNSACYLPAVCEFEIIRNNAEAISDMISEKPFQLVELGSGDGEKTKLLIQKFINKNKSFHYYPIDISYGAISSLIHDMKLRFHSSELKVSGLIGDYFSGLKSLPRNLNYRKIILFLGITLNNMPFGEAKLFFRRLRKHLGKKDLVLIGFDLVKSPVVLYKTYNDSRGLFNKLNLHLLDRINLKLKGNFNKKFFIHQSHYNPKNQAVESYLYSTRKQIVHFHSLDKKIQFNEWEQLQTERSYKYSIEKIKALTNKNEFKIVNELYDFNKHFVIVIWEVIK